ncbi:classical arabinogalactan protein 9-like [Phragmites australis]|uniref:classical arabinogalactan protein 9-like n=1 Tax=Phragmites australis TaxID=29695 RepID=UPI002D775ADE|nr:classical arabinogalactan protein 9-like [Phragmites australis]
MEKAKKLGRGYVSWNDEMDETLLNTFVEYYNKGDRAQNGRKSHVYITAIKNLHFERNRKGNDPENPFMTRTVKADTSARWASTARPNLDGPARARPAPTAYPCAAPRCPPPPWLPAPARPPAGPALPLRLRHLTAPLAPATDPAPRRPPPRAARLRPDSPPQPTPPALAPARPPTGPTSPHRLPRPALAPLRHLTAPPRLGRRPHPARPPANPAPASPTASPLDRVAPAPPLGPTAQRPSTARCATTVPEPARYCASRAVP